MDMWRGSTKNYVNYIIAENHLLIIAVKTFRPDYRNKVWMKESSSISGKVADF